MTSSNNPSQPAAYHPESKSRQFAVQLVVTQIATTAALSLCGLLISYQIALAILTGGMICSLANTWFAMVASRPVLGKPPGQIVAAFYVGEIGKFIVAAILFLIAFKHVALFKQPLYAALIIVVYAVVQSTAWVYPLARSRFYARWLK